MHFLTKKKHLFYYRIDPFFRSSKSLKKKHNFVEKVMLIYLSSCRKKENKKEKDEEEGADDEEDSEGEYTQVSPDYHGKFIYASEADKDATYH